MQTEGLVSYNNAVVTERYNPSASHTFGTFPYTGKAERGGLFAYRGLTQGRLVFADTFFYLFGSPVQGELSAAGGLRGW